MGLGIDWMTAVALWVANLPGAVGRVAAFGVGPLLVATAGLLLVCLLRSPLRWGGVLVAVAGLCFALRTRQPDIFVAPGAELVAVRTAAGVLATRKLGSNSFAAREWLAADADPRSPGDPSVRSGFACDDIGCIARLADGATIALALRPQAFEDDCPSAAIVISRRTAPPDCAAIVVDRTVWPGTGALAFTRRDRGWTISAAHPPGYDRPWALASRHDAMPTSGRAAPRTSPDATPSQDDLKPDD
jgi:competence protein ComEC